ncbi:MAG: CrcB family protein [Phycisphaeraceae bacterium]
MSLLVMIALGGALGAVARFVIDQAVMKRMRTVMPWGIWTVNLSGSLMLGLLIGATLQGPTAIALGTGFLGAYTTFSTWMYQSLSLIEQGAWRVAILNIVGPALLGPPAALAGIAIGGML